MVFRFSRPVFPPHFKAGPSGPPPGRSSTDADISLFVFLRDLIAVNWAAKQLMLLCFIAAAAAVMVRVASCSTKMDGQGAKF